MTLLDENAAILNDLASGGLDLTKACAVEFAHVFTNEADAEGFADAVEDDNHDVIVLEPEGEDDPWDVLVTVELTPSPEAVTEVEARLTQLAEDFHGEADGWGFHEDEFAED